MPWDADRGAEAGPGGGEEGAIVEKVRGIFGGEGGRRGERRVDGRRVSARNPFNYSALYMECGSTEYALLIQRVKVQND